MFLFIYEFIRNGVDCCVMPELDFSAIFRIHQMTTLAMQRYAASTPLDRHSRRQ
jgi:hypothetical protein